MKLILSAVVALGMGVLLAGMTPRAIEKQVEYTENTTKKLLREKFKKDPEGTWRAVIATFGEENMYEHNFLKPEFCELYKEISKEEEE